MSVSLGSQHKLVLAVERCAGVLARFERRLAGEHNVSVSQMRLLKYLLTQPKGVRISDLARDQGLALSTITRNMILLEKSGWLNRTTGTLDGREVTIELSERGKQLAAVLTTSTNELLVKAFAGFHPSDRIERAVALERVAAALESATNRPKVVAKAALLAEHG